MSRPREAAPWLARFEAELPGVAHRSFGLDDPSADASSVASLAEAGLKVDVSTILTARRGGTCPAGGGRGPAPGGDDDWAQRIALNQACYEEGRPPGEFVLRRADAERRRCEAGYGAWWGAFESGVLLAGCGIFAAGPGLARYQDVETPPRCAAPRAGRGPPACGRSARAGSLDARTLVIVADPDYHAIRLYEALGFVRTESQVGADRA